MSDASAVSAIRSRGGLGGRFVLAVLVVLAAAPSAAVAAVIVGAGSANLAWAPSEGAVAGYIVLGSRNGGPETSQGYTATQQFRVAGQPGDRLVVRIRAYGFTGPGGSLELSPPSEPSPEITFEAAPKWPTSELLALHCGGCAKVRLAVLASPEFRYEFPTLGPPWQPLGVGRLTSSGAPELAWRNGQTGQLAVTRIGAGAEIPLALSGASGMSSRLPLGLADVDGDGVLEILLRNQANGYVERWRASDGVVQPITANPIPVVWVFGGAHDFDGDGRDELFWQGDGEGDLRVSGWSGGQLVASQRQFDLGVAGTPVQVADFDGNGSVDVLLRDAIGGLSIAYFDPRGIHREVKLALPPYTTFYLLPPRVAANIDGHSGLEVVVQNQFNRAVFALWPSPESAPALAKLFDVDEDWRPFGRIR